MRADAGVFPRNMLHSVQDAVLNVFKAISTSNSWAGRLILIDCSATNNNNSTINLTNPLCRRISLYSASAAMLPKAQQTSSFFDCETSGLVNQKEKVGTACITSPVALWSPAAKFVRHLHNINIYIIIIEPSAETKAWKTNHSASDCTSMLSNIKRRVNKVGIPD